MSQVDKMVNRLIKKMNNLPTGGGGSVWNCGSGVPSNGLGNDGDYYLRTSNGDVYKKTSGTYSVVANIKGADGATGSQGSQGVQGPAGNNGAQGSQGPQGPAGADGAQGPQGIQGTQGPQGNPGTNGQGVPTGGSANQALTKIDGTNYNTQWVTLTKSSVGLGSVDNTADADKPVSNATTTAINLKAPLASPAFTGNVSSTGTLGYATGAGGTVTQATSKSTGVTLNKICGRITMHNAALAAAAEVSFTLTNSTIAADDVVVVCIKSGATAGAYNVQCDAVAAGSCRIAVGNMSAGSLSEALVLNFVVIKGVAA